MTRQTQHRIAVDTKPVCTKADVLALAVPERALRP